MRAMIEGPMRARRSSAKLAKVLLATAMAAALAGCTTPVGPVEVTRFRSPDAQTVGHGVIHVEPAPGQPDDLPFQAYAAAVGRELTRVGYTEPLPGAATGPDAPGYVALVTLDRQYVHPVRSRPPVTVGLGGVAGSYGSGAGAGVNIDLSGPPKEVVVTRLSVMIRERPSGKAVWEGRAAFTVRADAPAAQTGLGAAKMAQALFKGFPGTSGETIQVR